MLAKLTSGPRADGDASLTGAALTRGPNRAKNLKAAAWAETWPAPGSTLDLDFVNDRAWVRGYGSAALADVVSFSRASNATFVDETDVLRTVTAHQPCRDWGNSTPLVVDYRNVLTYTEQLDRWSQDDTVTTANATTAPNGLVTADFIAETAVTGNHRIYVRNLPVIRPFVVSFYAKRYDRDYVMVCNDHGSGWVAFNLVTQTIVVGHAAQTGAMIDVGDGWYRCIAYYPVGGVGAATQINLGPRIVPGGAYDAYLGVAGSGVYVWGVQVEAGTAVTDYVPILNPPVVTPLVATTNCQGWLLEEARTNHLLWCRDMSQASWVCTGLTPLLDQTGIDGAANSATRLTAIADGGTCLQTVTLAYGTKIGSVYLKRLNGTGSVRLCLDGTTWTPVALATDEWHRIKIHGSVANPALGIQLAVTGDAVAVDYAQIETSQAYGIGASSPIYTTTASATRATALTSVLKPHLFNIVYRPNFTLYVEACAQPGFYAFCPASINSGSYYYNAYFLGKFDNYGWWSWLFRNYDISGGIAVGNYICSSSFLPSKLALTSAGHECTASINGQLFPNAFALVPESPTPILSLRFTTLSIGWTAGDSAGHVARLVLFKGSLNSKQLAALTR